MLVICCQLFAPFRHTARTLFSLFLHHFWLQIHIWNESYQSISYEARYTFSHIRSCLRWSGVLKLFKCRPTPGQRNPLCLIGEGRLSLLGRPSQAGCTFKEDSGRSTPVIRGAYLTPVVSELKLMLRVINYSSFSACRSVKNPKIKVSITCLVYCQNCPSHLPELQGYVVMFHNFFSILHKKGFLCSARAPCLIKNLGLNLGLS